MTKLLYAALESFPVRIALHVLLFPVTLAAFGAGFVWRAASRAFLAGQQHTNNWF